MPTPDAPQAAQLALHAAFTITSGTQAIDSCNDLQALKGLARQLLSAWVVSHQGWLAQLANDSRRPAPCAPRSVETI